MKQIRNYPKAILTRKAENSILAGHPWVYNTEILKIEGAYQNGELIDVFNMREKYLGTGFINDHSKIRIRLLSRNANDVFDEAFFERRLRYAWNYRKTVMGNDLSCCRIIFGEADQFPGLTVDRFNNILVTQTLSLGMEKLKPILFPLLYKILAEDGQAIDGVYERNDVTIRELEGMEQNKGFYPIPGLPQPESTETTILENGIEYSVDFENGQKTGFFLDQKYNRKAVAQLSRGKKVLDCFTHTGSFALNAAKGGRTRPRRGYLRRRHRHRAEKRRAERPSGKNNLSNRKCIRPPSGTALRRKGRLRFHHIGSSRFYQVPPYC